MENREESFNYTYDAAQQAEVEKIRRKYIPPQEDKMAELRRLDASVSQKAQAAAIVLGVIGCLIFGTGMSLCMTELSGFLGGTAMFIGIPVGLVGLVMVALAYPLYNRILKKERARIAPQILQLTEELLNG